jgi:hypothetical protein
MPFKESDVQLYRRNEKAGGKLLTPEERIKLLEVCLPSNASIDDIQLIQSQSRTSRPRKKIKNEKTSVLGPGLDDSPLESGSSSRHSFTSLSSTSFTHYSPSTSAHAKPTMPSATAYTLFSSTTTATQQ